MKRFLIRLLKLGAVVYVVLLIAVFFLQRNFMYFPPQGNHPDAAKAMGMEPVAVPTDEANFVNAWWHPPEAGEPVVIFFHGNGSAVHGGGPIYHHFMEQGFGVLGAEYPGYSGSTGSPSEESLIAAAVAQYDFVRKNNADSKIYLYGTSLGAGIAVQLASSREVSKLVLEAPFNSMLGMVRLRMPIFAFPFLVKDHYRSDLAIEELSVPILWLHGTADRVIPMEEGQKLYDAYKGPKEKLIIDRAGHNNIWVSGGRDRITRFLRQ